MANDVTLKGKIIKVYSPVTGVGAKGNWEKVDYLIESPDQYKKKILITAFAGIGKPDLKIIKEGLDVVVSCNVESRESNGKWFTNFTSFRIKEADESNTIKGNSKIIGEIKESEESDDLPF